MFNKLTVTLLVEDYTSSKLSYVTHCLRCAMTWEKGFSQQYILMTRMPLIIWCITNALSAEQSAMRNLRRKKGYIVDYKVMSNILFYDIFISRITNQSPVSIILGKGDHADAGIICSQFINRLAVMSYSIYLSICKDTKIYWVFKDSLQQSQLMSTEIL